jgi:hypothetical protein
VGLEAIRVAIAHNALAQVSGHVEHFDHASPASTRGLDQRHHISHDLDSSSQTITRVGSPHSAAPAAAEEDFDHDIPSAYNESAVEPVQHYEWHEDRSRDRGETTGIRVDADVLGSGANCPTAPLDGMASLAKSSQGVSYLGDYAPGIWTCRAFLTLWVIRQQGCRREQRFSMPSGDSPNLLPKRPRRPTYGTSRLLHHRLRSATDLPYHPPPCLVQASLVGNGISSCRRSPRSCLWSTPTSVTSVS